MVIRRMLTGTVAVVAWLLAITACETSGEPVSTPSHRSAPVPFFGIDVPHADVREVQRVASVLGCTPSVVSAFVKLDTEFTVRDLRALSRDGAVPFLTLEPWSRNFRSGQTTEPSYRLASVSSGVHDAALARIGLAIAAYGKPVYLRYAHEMNGDWYPWSSRVNGGSPTKYVAAWRHTHDVMVRAGARSASWVWSPAALASGPHGGGRATDPAAVLAAMYPGDHYVDFVGFTGYGGGPSAAATFAPWVDEVGSFTTRPVILSEIGADGPRKVDWIASLAPYLTEHPAIVGFVWFNTTPASTGASGYYRIDDSPAQVGAFRAVLTHLRIPCSTSNGRQPT